MTDLGALLPQILFALGVGFLVANLLALRELLRWMRRRSAAVLVWAAPKPPYYGLSLAIGVMLGVLILFNAIVQLRPPASLFGEVMMFVYYGYMLPLSTRIKRGLYEDGIWADAGFVPYTEIGGLTWKDGEHPTLVLVARRRAVARRLQVPGPRLGEVRRLLRERISSHDIEFDGGPGLHLGERDTRESV
ncbi:MAG: hypothetical protein AB7O67_10540 [Vicinamibacterales bacterium]